jgi:dCMP deaminase
MNTRLKLAHMRAAGVYAELSYAQRRKVGCVVVKGDTIVAIGYNGTPPGWDNACEGVDGKTIPEVIHAEQNALDKIMRSAVSSEGASVFVTTAPCIECAKRLLGARVKEVFYRDVYRTEEGLYFLQRAGIHTERIEDEISNQSEQDAQGH